MVHDRHDGYHRRRLVPLHQPREEAHRKYLSCGISLQTRIAHLKGKEDLHSAECFLRNAGPLSAIVCEFNWRRKESPSITTQ